MTTIASPEFTASEIDGTALRQTFADKFLSEEGLNPFDFTMEELIDKFDMELGEAKRRWPSLSVDREWADMDQWLSERGYVEPEYREL